MLDKLETIQDRYYYLEEKLSDPEVLADMKQFAKINKEYKDLTEIIETYREYKMTVEHISNAREMLKDTDPEMREMAESELSDLNPQLDELQEKINYLLIPKDPEDTKDVVLKFGPEQVEMKPVFLPVICSGCIPNILKVRAGRQKSSMKISDP